MSFSSSYTARHTISPIYHLKIPGSKELTDTQNISPIPWAHNPIPLIDTGNLLPAAFPSVHSTQGMTESSIGKEVFLKSQG